ncbi:hypothetical protein [Corynebacterium cystitidis]|uniref:hypothetical protein n=1 Tax=Corynebacterium cystitidis TaxID=35757 RepID=UPI000BA4AF10|nr:hypothetical protein [Corynebacterium cystitidis]
MIGRLFEGDLTGGVSMLSTAKARAAIKAMMTLPRKAPAARIPTVTLVRRRSTVKDLVSLGSDMGAPEAD